MSPAKHTSKNGKTILISCKRAAGFGGGGMIKTCVSSKKKPFFVIGVETKTVRNRVSLHVETVHEFPPFFEWEWFEI